MKILLASPGWQLKLATLKIAGLAEVDVCLQNKFPARISMADVRSSKFLSYLLRHGAAEHRLHVSRDGFVKLSDILNLPQSKTLKLDAARVQSIVEKNDKKRFELMTDGNGDMFIRACQGHSMKQLDDSALMTAIIDPKLYPIVVHGTSEEAYKKIKTEGLKVMNRNHVHFAIGYPENREVVSGMRRNCQIFIEIDMEKAMSDGIKFFLSTNKVVLSAGNDGVIEPKYFKTVRDKNRQVMQ
jgi:2'-phosphotransferase